MISGTFLTLPVTGSNLLKVPSMDVLAPAPTTTKVMTRFDRQNFSPSSEIDLARMSALEKFRSKSTSCLLNDVDDAVDAAKNRFQKSPKIVIQKIRRKSHEVGDYVEGEKKTLAKKLLTHRRCHSAAMLLPNDTDAFDVSQLGSVEKNNNVYRSTDAIDGNSPKSVKSVTAKSSTFPRSASTATSPSSKSVTSLTQQVKFGKKLFKTMSVPVKHFLVIWGVERSLLRLFILSVSLILSFL